ncbi:hypothetical protein [Hymenobacter sp. CRA2]|uniref:hypothetical protein n=1 Tax=Hymenobacter sp. CRA2 TaxID=1955620 RepID=UPI00098EA96A|nr:hypothetical protein [Hymenobacter sp. CRA2]OON68819.1 hypothetical protein B0919_11590 [Hymenobacter sp. CRA2]
MALDKLSDSWLFQQHSRATIKEWVNQLRYFCFIRAWGGHANDGDEFRAQLQYADRADLLAKLGRLGIHPNRLPPDFPRPVVGQAYPAAEFKQFKSEIRRFPDLEQPGHVVLFGYRVFMWVTDFAIQLSVSGTRDDNRYEVTEDDFRACRDLERHFDVFGWQQALDRTMQQSVCCISRTRYPELYG